MVDAGPQPDGGQWDGGTRRPDAQPVDAGAFRPDATSRDAEPTPDAGPSCGNDYVEAPEECDDGDSVPGDGCSPTCEVEDGWSCEGNPSHCVRVPDLFIDDVTVQEGQVATFTVTLSATTSTTIVFRWSTRDDSATSPNDYTSTVGDEVVPPGQFSVPISIPTHPDTNFEPTETFFIEIQNVRGAVPVDPVGIGAIENRPTPLVDRGLVTRYFLDEAASGMAPMTAFDAATNPLHLTIAYSTQPTFVERPTGRGLSWAAIGLGGAFAGVSGTKIEQRLHLSTTGTLEAVIEVTAATAASRIIHIGRGTEFGDFTMGVNRQNQVVLGINGQASVFWPYPGGLPAARAVLTIVYDTQRMNRNNRVRLFIDGQLQPASTNLVMRDDPLDILQGTAMVIGNRPISGVSYSPEGQIFYAAVYDSALSAAEVAQNAMILLARDDP